MRRVCVRLVSRVRRVIRTALCFFLAKRGVCCCHEMTRYGKGLLTKDTSVDVWRYERVIRRPGARGARDDAQRARVGHGPGNMVGNEGREPKTRDERSRTE